MDMVGKCFEKSEHLSDSTTLVKVIGINYGLKGKVVSYSAFFNSSIRKMYGSPGPKYLKMYGLHKGTVTELDKRDEITCNEFNNKLIHRNLEFLKEKVRMLDDLTLSLHSEERINWLKRNSK